MRTEPDITELLLRWGRGDQTALARLMPVIYGELRRIARQQMARQDAGHTLQTTALVHEAWLKLAAGSEHDWKSRTHFFGVAAKAMRHILVDSARRRLSEKRGLDRRVVPFDEQAMTAPERARELVALDDALTTLAQLRSRQERVVELRYFAGLSVEETAKVLGISAETVARDWKSAKAFLHREMKRMDR